MNQELRPSVVPVFSSPTLAARLEDKVGEEMCRRAYAEGKRKGIPSYKSREPMMQDQMIIRAALANGFTTLSAIRRRCGRNYDSLGHAMRYLEANGEVERGPRLRSGAQEWRLV